MPPPKPPTPAAPLDGYPRLSPAANLKSIFRRINNHLTANTHLPRTAKQGAEMIRLILCKLTDEHHIRGTARPPQFQLMAGESGTATRRRLDALWEKTKTAPDNAAIFTPDERITLDDDALQFIVTALQKYALLKTDRDAVGDAFEVFSERQFAGEKGQFFTPRAVVKMIINILNPSPAHTLIDPACGSGGFLIAALHHIAAEDDRKRDIAEHCLYGIDKDADLAKICRAQMCIIGDGKSNIVTADSLKAPDKWPDAARSKLLHNGAPRQFDFVATNPPFGSKIKIDRPDILRDYELARGGKSTPPQVLFIEKCIKLLKPGGKLGIVLPDGLLGNPGDTPIRRWLARHTDLLAVIDCPTATFMPHTGTKTSVLIAQKKPSTDAALPPKKPFFAIAEHCGHTYRGTDITTSRGTPREDFTRIAHHYTTPPTHPTDQAEEHLGFHPTLKNDILVPRYYDPRITRRLRHPPQSITLIPVADLLATGAIALTGLSASVSSEDYDLHGDIRFIRTSDIGGCELSENPQKMVSRHSYESHRAKQDLQIGDILFVKDGDTRIGETAILLDEHDCRILVQTHFKRFRALTLNPFLLLWMLNTDIVKQQIRQRVFNQSTLSTIGDRLADLRLPHPKDPKKAAEIAATIETLTKTRRTHLRHLRHHFTHLP